MAAALITDFSALPPGERNVIWRFFTNPYARERHDADSGHRFARESVADLRAAAARYPRDAGVRKLVDRLLAASTEFRDLWAEQDVQVRRSGQKRLHHPLVGRLDLDCEALHDPDRDQWIVLYTAAPGTPRTGHSACSRSSAPRTSLPRTGPSVPRRTARPPPGRRSPEAYVYGPLADRGRREQRRTAQPCPK